MVRSRAAVSTYRKLAIALLAALALTALGLYLSTSTHGLLQAPRAAAAGDPIYMQYGSIQGDVTAVGWEHWVELNSLSWGVSRAISSAAGSGSREAAAPQAAEVKVTMLSSNASPDFFQEATVGQAATVTIDFVKTDNVGHQVKYIELKLTNALASSYQVSSGGDRPTDSLSIDYTKIQFTNYEAQTGGPITRCFDYAIVRAC
jgi:type VI secretion system secreted protein Hcp